MSTALAGLRTSRWFKLVWIVPAIIVGLFLIVLAANAIRSSVGGQQFLASYPGEATLPVGAPVGFPAWLSWQHALNAFFLLLIVRSGWQVRTVKRPNGFWTRNNRGILKTKNPPTRLSLNLWFHLSLDVLWFLNGLLFFVLIFATGQWLRIIPTSWDAFPNALSALLQYASLNWPTENGWVNYNGLQLLAYFTITFIAAPLAIISGIRMSPLWPKNTPRLDRFYPMPVARAIHLPVMFFFVAFVIVHVTLVLATGALRNLNHMYAGRTDDNWIGFIIFAISLVVMAAAWIATTPLVLRTLAGLTGSVSR